MLARVHVAIVPEAGLYFPFLDAQITALGPGLRWGCSPKEIGDQQSLHTPSTSLGGLPKAGSVVAPQDRRISHPSALPTLFLEAAGAPRSQDGIEQRP